jgi:hypothetical protein
MLNYQRVVHRAHKVHRCITCSCPLSWEKHGKTVLLRKPCLENFDGHPPCVNWLGKFFDGSSWIVASSWWICTVIVIVVYSYLCYIYNIYIYTISIYTIHIYIYPYRIWYKASSPEMMTSRFSEKSPPTKHSKRCFEADAVPHRGYRSQRLFLPFGDGWPIYGDLGDGLWLGLPHDMVKKDVQNTTDFFVLSANVLDPSDPRDTKLM